MNNHRIAPGGICLKDKCPKGIFSEIDEVPVAACSHKQDRADVIFEEHVSRSAAVNKNACPERLYIRPFRRIPVLVPYPHFPEIPGVV